MGFETRDSSCRSGTFVTIFRRHKAPGRDRESRRWELMFYLLAKSQAWSMSYWKANICHKESWSKKEHWSKRTVQVKTKCRSLWKQAKSLRTRIRILTFHEILGASECMKRTNSDLTWPFHMRQELKKNTIKRKVLNDPDWIARTSICTHRHEMAMQREAHEMVSFLTLNYTGWPHCLWNVCLSSLNPKLYVDGIKRARCDTGLKRDRNPHLLSRPWTLSK